MKLLRSFVMVAAVGLALGATADRAEANGLGLPCVGCARGGSGFGGAGLPQPQRSTLFGSGAGGHSGLGLFQPKPKLPVFQAAPWYQYWPYDGHFMTPAPVGGAFYAPPMTGNFPVNPYFPGGQGGYNYGPPPGYPQGYPQLPPGVPQPIPQPMPGGGR